MTPYKPLLKHINRGWDPSRIVDFEEFLSDLGLAGQGLRFRLGWAHLKL